MCLLTWVNQRITPAMIRNTTAALAMSIAALSIVRVTAEAFTAKLLTQPWRVGTRPAAVELVAAGSNWTGTVATAVVVVVEFDAACRMSGRDMPSHAERR